MFILTLFVKLILGFFIIALILAFLPAIFLLMTVGTEKIATPLPTKKDIRDDEPEMVHHPDHYNRPGQKECIVEMEEKFGPRAVMYFCLLSRYKYLYRCGLKDGITQELSKANWYRDKFLSLGGDDELLNTLPDNARTVVYRKMGVNAHIEKETKNHES